MTAKVVKKAAPKKAAKIDWQLVGTCPACVAPVFYAFGAGNQQVHIWRTCNHNTPPQFGNTAEAGPSVSAPEIAE